MLEIFVFIFCFQHVTTRPSNTQMATRSHPHFNIYWTRM